MRTLPVCWHLPPGWLLVVTPRPSYYISCLTSVNSGVKKVIRAVLSVGAGRGRLPFLPLLRFWPHLDLPSGAQAAARAHRGALCSRHRAPGGESALRRWLRVLPARGGANPRRRGRRPRPSASPSVCRGEGSGRTPPAAA